MPGVTGGAGTGGRDVAAEPEDLARLFLDRANAGDVEGVVALYEPDAVLALAGGEVVAGHAAIRGFYSELLAAGRRFGGDIRPALRSGDLALTSTRFAGGATAEIARRQADGSWRWIADQPNVLA
jgi:ketosteroid isomerase-like protein